MKHIKRFTALVLALVMVFSLTTGASAAGAENVKVQLSPNITVTYNGEPQTMADVNGNPVYPILNGGTTYLPIRAVGNMLGLDVDWDGATQTVLLNKSADGKAPAKSGNAVTSGSAPTEITAQINPGITVKYNGKAQNMADVNGNPVYPMLYGGTTYLPVRAVSNMLGIAVDWDGATQTVILTEPNADNDTGTSGEQNSIHIDATDPDEIRNALTVFKSIGLIDFDIDDAFKTLTETGEYTVNGITFTCGEIDETEDFNARYKTSADAEILGDNHIGYDWAEIDWSHANDGYVRVKLNKEFTKYTECHVSWLENKRITTGKGYDISTVYKMKTGTWLNIPLPAGSNDYAVEIHPVPMDVDGDLTDEELDVITSKNLIARFTAEIENPNAAWLVSTIDVDYENAPLTCAKALEITKNCKTDAEKVTAVFNWVAQNIKYDYKLYEEHIQWMIKFRAGEINIWETPFKDGAREYLVLDDILTSKSGLCEDYATLMVGMLRSLGIPCKYVGGSVYSGKIIKGYNDNNPGWVNHGWVAVSPELEETLNMTALGAGHEADGWIRLDPTWGDTASGRAKAAVDENHRANSAY